MRKERKKREGGGLKKDVKAFGILYSKSFKIKNTRRLVSEVSKKEKNLASKDKR